MFQDSLLESAGRLKTHRGTTTAISVAVQSLLIGFIVVAPLFYIQALPKLFNIMDVPSAPAPATQSALPDRRQHPATQSEVSRRKLLTPTHIPVHIAIVTEHQAPPPIASLGFGGPNGVPGGGQNGVPGSILGNALAPAVPNIAPPLRLRISSGVSQGLLVHQVEPIYPPLALNTRVHGAVVLQAIVARDGTISNLRVMSGHPWLARAALDAVSRWRYRPYLLNGGPVEVETNITVNFTLSGN